MLRSLILRLLRGKFDGIETLETMPDDIYFSYLFERGIMLFRGLLLFRRLCFIGKGVRFKCKKRIRLGHYVTIQDYSFVDASSLKGVVIEDYCTIGRGNFLRTGNLASYDGYFVMRKNSSTNNNCFLGATGGMEIGSNVLIGPNVTIVTERHEWESLEATIKDQGVVKAPVIIEDDTWIGSNAVILGGCVIGGGAIVGAGSIVTKSVGNGDIVAGNPARVIRNRNEI